MATKWPDSLDEIIYGDHAVIVAYATPANGAVLAPVSNFALHDNDAAVVTFNTSVGAPKKLERIRQNPRVALAFHTRAHATHERPEYVLLQGVASLSEPVPDYPSTIVDAWERFEPWRDRNAFWRRWQRIYALRVEARVTVERVIVWPDLGCRGHAEVIGPSLPDRTPPQAPPAKGMAPRIAYRRAARRAQRLPDVLVGWIGGDGFPLAVAAEVSGTDERGMLLDLAPGLVPAGGRRAGLTAHWFSRGVLGQRQMLHTGWMEAADDGTAVYAPHTLAAYRMPTSRFVYRLAVGAATRWRYRGAAQT